MYYYTYEIYIDNPESALNGCYYYGKHKALKLSDNYFGSGKLIQRYIKKYGTSTLQKTILEYYPNRESLQTAERLLIDEKFQLLGHRCLNLHEGGTGGRWVMYCTPEEYEWRRQRVIEGIYEKTTSEQRSEQARKAGLAKNNVSEQQRKHRSQSYKEAFARMSLDAKVAKYSKVSQSMKKFFANPDNKEIIAMMKEHNKETNIKSAKKWRDEFFQLFHRTPESFRNCGKMKSAIDLYKQIQTLTLEEQNNEINRFMESIT